MNEDQDIPQRATWVPPSGEMRPGGAQTPARSTTRRWSRGESSPLLQKMRAAVGGFLVLAGAVMALISFAAGEPEGGVRGLVSVLLGVALVALSRRHRTSAVPETAARRG